VGRERAQTCSRGRDDTSRTMYPSRQEGAIEPSISVNVRKNTCPDDEMEGGDGDPIGL